MERRPHILVMPYPAQGHVLPLMELSHCLVNHGLKITFVNTEFNHQRVIKSLIQKDYISQHISLVSIPDGLQPQEDRNDLKILTESLLKVVPGKLEELIHSINATEDNKITCMIADEFIGWVLQVAEKLQISRAAFFPASAAVLALTFSIPKLISDGIIDHYGTPLKNMKVKLSSEMPPIDTAHFGWACLHDEALSKLMFDVVNKNNNGVKLTDWIVCNSACDLEPGAFSLSPNIQPIGPLLASTRQGHSTGCFWKENTDCLQWLDQQPPQSVIYIAFGSHTVFEKNQMQELALGIELTGKPFLWVARPGLTSHENVFPQGFEERVASRGKMVEWAPQQKVLSHPSVGCFVSHCGWNSTMEGVSNGVPFLCWPYFADQFLNETYICDVWKVGLKFECDEFGMIRQEEIKNKVESVFGNDEFRERAKELKEKAMKSVGEGGLSKKIFSQFVEWLSARR